MVLSAGIATFTRAKAEKPGYWWLAYQFENYLFSCSSCNNAKGNCFPVKTPRPSVTEGCEAKEKPWALNPFEANPTCHLRFDELGGVAAITRTGFWTIGVYALDRAKLVRARSSAAVNIARDIEDYEDAVIQSNALAQGQCLRRLRDACTESVQYAAMARQIVEKRIGLTHVELEAVVSKNLV